jgi:4'-phosphopantetheinyl transferase EntD
MQKSSNWTQDSIEKHKMEFYVRDPGTIDDKMPGSFSIASILPKPVAIAETVGASTGRLLSEEKAALGRMSDKRRQDFTLGRECAHQALQNLGVKPVPIPRGPAREPLWPPSVVGSITHCEGYFAAVACFKSDITSIGIDAEPHEMLPDGVFETISLHEERLWIASAESDMPWRLLLFSAKESVFKAWFPLVGTWLRFDHAQIQFDSSMRSFRAIILPSAPRTPRAPVELVGKFHVSAGYVATCAFIRTKDDG